MSETISSSLEDYLETILLISKENPVVRAKAIATRMKVRSSSVTGALRILAEKGFIHYTPYDVITFTPEGERMAGEVLLRHKTLQEFFTRVLQVEPSLAEEAACHMEHGVPRPLLERLIAYLTFMDGCPNARAAWDAEIGFRCKRECISEGYPNCLNALSVARPMSPPDVLAPPSNPAVVSDSPESL